jgi:hypothetical protein
MSRPLAQATGIGLLLSALSGCMTVGSKAPAFLPLGEGGAVAGGGHYHQPALLVEGGSGPALSCPTAYLRTPQVTAVAAFAPSSSGTDLKPVPQGRGEAQLLRPDSVPDRTRTLKVHILGLEPRYAWADRSFDLPPSDLPVGGSAPAINPESQP